MNLLLSVLYGISGVVLFLVSTYQYLLGIRYSYLVKDLQQIFQPCGILYGLCHIAISIDEANSYPYWIALILRDLLVCVIIVSGFYWLNFTCKIIQVSIESGFLTRYLSRLSLCICIGLMITFAVTDFLAILLNSQRIRAIIQFYWVLVSFIAAFMSIKSRKEIKKTNDILRKHADKQAQNKLQKFILAAFLSIIYGISCILLALRSLTSGESLEEAETLALDDPMPYIRWLIYVIGGIFLPYTSWITYKTTKDPPKDINTTPESLQNVHDSIIIM